MVIELYVIIVHTTQTKMLPDDIVLFYCMTSSVVKHAKVTLVILNKVIFKVMVVMRHKRIF